MADVQEKSVEVCFSPGLFRDILTKDDFVVVLVDILRATTTICTAVANGVEAIIPVATHEEARRLKAEGFLVASEKDGVQLDFADFGNSAFSFTRDRIGGKTLVYCTTNGTRAIKIAESAGGIAIGAFVNISALTEWLARRRKNVVVLCSGWKNRFCLEDTLFAGALTGRLLATGSFRYRVRLGARLDGSLEPGRGRRAGLHREGRSAPPPEEAGAGRRASRIRSPATRWRSCPCSTGA